MPRTQFTIALPDWCAVWLEERPAPCVTPQQRMRLVVELAQRHVDRQTGGPFAAAVFDATSGRVVSLGLNVVARSGLSIAHAEIVALSLAQGELQSFDLSAGASAPLQLVTSAEPCCQCYGAIHWSGIRSVVCGARASDVRQIGFDEGDKPLDWPDHLAARGIAVQQDVLREDAVGVLRRYAEQGGLIYNPAGRPAAG
ncbi:MAG: nucleoside deaminase [Pirellulaceae bacterium]|nr:nucleoside deaminase [Pirellulaceae bacterium]